MLRRGEDRSNDERLATLTQAEIEASIDLEEEGEVDWDTLRVDFPWSTAQQTVRLDTEVLDWFRAEGPGYQTRINAVLRNYVEQQKKAS